MQEYVSIPTVLWYLTTSCAYILRNVECGYYNEPTRQLGTNVKSRSPSKSLPSENQRPITAFTTASLPIFANAKSTLITVLLHRRLNLNCVGVWSEPARHWSALETRAICISNGTVQGLGFSSNVHYRIHILSNGNCTQGRWIRGSGKGVSAYHSECRAWVGFVTVVA